MKFCLINPPWFFMKNIEFISHNIGLGYIISVLEAESHEVQFIDALVEGVDNKAKITTKYQTVYRYGLSYDEITTKIERDVDFIGITSPFTDSALIIRELIAAIKKVHPEKPIIVGGVYASTLPQDVLAADADIVVKGEGELAMLDIARGKSLKNIPGLVFKDGNDIVDTGNAEVIEDIDTIPFPSFSKRPIDYYFSWSPRGARNKRTASMITSRGCPFKCNFCSIHPVYGHKWRARSPENVLKEIDILANSFGVSNIEFEDDNFTLKPERAEAILDGIVKFNKNRAQGETLSWSAPNGIRIDTLTEKLIKKMSESSCQSICIAIESGDPEILRRMNKKTDLKKIEQTVKLLVKHKIACNAFFIIGYPGETEQRFFNTVEFALKLKKIGLSSISVLVATPYPGTALFQECKDNGNLRRPDSENVLYAAQYSDYQKEFVQIETLDFSADDIMRRYNYFQNKFGDKSIKYNIYSS